MGTDINFYAEYKSPDHGTWIADPKHRTAQAKDDVTKGYDCRFEMGRNTSFFYYLIDRLHPGVPKDLSATVKRCYENDSGIFGTCHGSLLDYKKAIIRYHQQLLADHDEEMCFVFRTNVSPFVSIIEYIERVADREAATDIRLIFWFDN